MLDGALVLVGIWACRDASWRRRCVPGVPNENHRAASWRPASVLTHVVATKPGRFKLITI